MPYPIAAVRERNFFQAVATLTYAEKVLATEPSNLLAYFICGEASGTVMQEEKNNYDGAYTGVTLGQTGIGDGNTCPLFDGANDYGNLYTAGLAGVFNGAEGTMAVWCKMNTAGVWTDSTQRYLYRLAADTSNRADITKQATTNQLRFRYTAGGTEELVTDTSLAGTANWFHLAMTWSVAADQVIAYINGAQVGATQTGLGTWAGALSSTSTVIGALNTTPSAPHYGYLAHVPIWNVALNSTQIADLATV